MPSQVENGNERADETPKVGAEAFCSLRDMILEEKHFWRNQEGWDKTKETIERFLMQKVQDLQESLGSTIKNQVLDRISHTTY